MLHALPGSRPLKPPTWHAAPRWAYTLGPEVATICRLANFAPDPEQQLLLDGTFAVAKNGKAAAFEVDVVAARRAMKTGFIVQCILGWLFVTHERKIVYSAQDLQAAEEAWRTVADLIEGTPALAKQLKPTRGERPGIVEGNGRWAIVLAAIPEEGIPERRVIFRRRGVNTGRALGGGRVILDEGFALTARQMGSLLPILGAEPDPQYVLASSAGMVDSQPLIDARDRGRDGGTHRQFYAEWCDPRGDQADKGCRLGEKCTHRVGSPNCALDDETRWAEVIPELGGRVQVDTIRGLRATLPAEEFAREFLVWWDIDGAKPKPPIDPDDWRTLLNEDAPAPLLAELFIDVSPDQRSASIGVASSGSNGRTLLLTWSQAGTDWVVPKVAELCESRDIETVALVAQSQAGALIPDLVRYGVEFQAVTQTEVSQACAWLQKAVIERTVEHVGQRKLDAAVTNAVVRYTGAGESQRWDRADWSIDISPLVAASGAGFRWAQQPDDGDDAGIY